ncbi:DNA cytosine methyltransferase [Pseudomonas asuensis]|uniref:DNA (cytosine-5-)-methyltransferase n=1 Tax=Pseudomonas asuensis TaxID=1825787 RepID=A0ABQ2H3P6_9PSED|nr:DNA cytosine methyltransferase [Pseudomonas asuensis]GGM26242.1 hypothetical protein GCM10009425_41170 [Pseudomonas asuensis]
MKQVLKHFHFCCGLGGGAKGFNLASPRVGNVQAEWQCLGGVDVDGAALKDFERLAGVPGTQMDLFTRDQYVRFHGMEPPAGWREATADDIRRAAQYQDPNCVFISSPCKGASGLLPEEMSRTPKYQALNELTLRCVWLMCEAWKDNPVDLIVFENVPRLATRGRYLLDQIGALLSSYGYAVAETTHDCGELGGLAQSRKRFLLVARHIEKVPPFLYEPPKKTLRAVGDVLSRMPLAGDIGAAGPMHRVPQLQWKTWVRLALVEAGKDWRSLNRLAVDNGYLRDYVLAPEAEYSTSTVDFARVADPRIEGHPKSVQMGIRQWDQSAGVVTGKMLVGGGPHSIADPRLPEEGQSLGYRIVPANLFPQTHNHLPLNDPRPQWKRHGNNMTVMDWDGPARTVIAGGKGVQGGWMSIADPRPGMARQKGDAYLTGGHYGVVDFNEYAGAVSASACHDNGRWSVADPCIPAENDRLTCMIRSLDNTWHRPFTTLELAALQSLIDPEEHWSTDAFDQLEIKRRQFCSHFTLAGNSNSDWRERIGNAVPPAAAQAIAEVMGTTLLLAAAGETFMLNSMPIWVRNVAIALNVAQMQ